MAETSPNDAVEAIAAENALAPLLLEREERVVRNMVSLYMAGKLDAARLYGMVGQLVEIRQIEQTLNRESREAILDAEESHG